MVRFVRLNGNRIALRDWREIDVAAWRQWMTPGQQWHQLDAPYYPKPTAEHTEQMAVKVRDRIRNGDWPTPRQRVVIALRDTDELIGMVSWSWESEATWWPQVGIAIFDPNDWGKGIGFEALGLWSQYLFDHLPQIVRLDLRTWSGNTGMMRLAEKLGYVREATFRQARIVDGVYYDSVGYGVLRGEWQRRYPDGFGSVL